MPSPSRRADRVAEAIRAEVATFLRESAKDPRIVGLVTVTGVDTTRDLRNSVVFVSILGTPAEREATLEGLRSLATHLRGVLGRALRLRVAPEITFKLDDSVQRAARIDALLNQVRDGGPARDGGSSDA
ncbi:MAG TPA: 30S ribosome-binding factor RbfA [Gemmatimonadaceae bacterium]|nr:30S ribosome-binding factor RbfA [Gemmatimonadaceae bacterium]